MKAVIKSYSDMTQQEKDNIIVMLEQVWSGFINCCEIHHNDLNVQSVYIYDQQKVIAYTGIVLQKTIYHNQTLTVASLSCVAVLEAYRKRGIGQFIITKATEWIQSQDIDIGIFTCHPSLVYFYTHKQCWQVANKVILKANHHKYAISSDKIDVKVLICCFLKNLNIENTTLYLDLPIDQFV